MDKEKSTETMIVEIHQLLTGCEEYKQEGLIESHNKVKAKVDKHDLYFRIVFGICTISGFVLVFWKDLKTIFS